LPIISSALSVPSDFGFIKTFEYQNSPIQKTSTNPKSAIKNQKGSRAKKAREPSKKSLCSCLAVFTVEQVNLKSPLLSLSVNFRKFMKKNF